MCFSVLSGKPWSNSKLFLVHIWPALISTFSFSYQFPLFSFPLIPLKIILLHMCIVLFFQNSTLFLLSSNARDIEFSQLLFFTIFWVSKMWLVPTLFSLGPPLLSLYGTPIINCYFNSQQMWVIRIFTIFQLNWAYRNKKEIGL